MIETTEPVLWFVARASGLTSLVFLTLSVALGIAAGARRPALPRFVTQGMHRTCALTGLLLLVVHVAAVVADPYVPLEWTDVFWPFAAGYEPLWTGLGTVALDLMLVIIASSVVRHRIGLRTWRGIHLTAYAAYALSIGHGLGAGTDAQEPAVAALTGTSVGVVVAALVLRLYRDHDRTDRRYRTDPAHSEVQT
jgi:methionine sulfoxide reductase heme-binding subunit